MLNEPEISIVCPTYNTEAYLRNTLDALLSQQTHAGQIIFSDDGSTDNTVMILEQYKAYFEEKNIDVVILKNQHLGPGGARNKAIERATGKWVAFLDADDMWEANKIKRVKEEIVQHSGANFFIHWEKFHRLNGEIIKLYHASQYDPNTCLQRQLYKNCMFSTSAVTVKRELLLMVEGFNVTYPNAQDYELWLRLSPYIKLHIIKEFLGYYIEVSTSITSRPYHKKIWALVRIYWVHRKKSSYARMSYQLLRLLITRQWFLS